VEIREASADDVDLLARMRMHFLAERTGTPLEEVLAELAEPMRDFFADLLAKGTVWSWLAEAPEPRDDGLCAGIVSMLLGPVAPRPREARTLEGHVINMFVLPDHRSAGLGRRLLDAALDAAEGRGVRTVVLHAAPDGRPLYESTGFRPHPDWLELPLPRERRG
jgi:GNAT superfamily N-acetyltransferase